MKQFVVPQFIDVEDKIFGPITTRQFLILLIAALFLFLAFRLSDTALFAFWLIVVGGSALVLAFVRINGQAFHFVLLNIVQTLRRPSRRVWSKQYSNQELEELRRAVPVDVEVKPSAVPQLSYNRLRDLSLIVNTGGYYRPE